MQARKSIPSFYDLREILLDEQRAESFLFESGVFYPRPSCYSCNGPTKRRNLSWLCLKKSCAKTISIAKDSFFELSKLKYSQILVIAYLWLIKTPASSIEIFTGHSNTTVCSYMKYLNQSISEGVTEEECVIGGPNIEVELDECKISKRKYNRGKHIEGAWIFGGVERTPERRIFVEQVPNRSKETLQELIQKYVRPGSRILTDCWKGYSTLDALGYEHGTVNHSKHFKDPETHVHTNGIEARWSGIKRSIPVRNRTANAIDSHLLAYIWRNQNIDRLWDAFISVLSDTKFT